MKIKCPSCSKHYKFESNRVGRKFECPECDHKFVISENDFIESSQETVQKDGPIEEVGNYKIIKQLGTGGAGLVYLAEHPSFKIPVAIKVLDKSVCDNLNNSRRFIREAQLAASVTHPNILRIFDAGLHESQLYYVMEYVDGGSVAQTMEDQGLCFTEAECFEVALAITSALKEAHKSSIVHRDIKPDNIMCTKDGEYKLADLGLAKIHDQELSTASLTGIHSAMGTPYFMPPEQALDAKQADIRSDIYALGVSLYQLSTGKLPFTGKNATQIFHQQINKNPLSPQILEPKLSDHFTQIILTCLQKNPDDRFQNPTELELVLRTTPKAYFPVQDIILVCVLLTFVICTCLILFFL